jgi:hypothetical protein
MSLRNIKKSRGAAELPTKTSDLEFKKTSTRSKPSSEPILLTAPMEKASDSPKAKTDIDIDDLRRQYANNPQALQALEEYFRGLQTESGIYSSRTEETTYSSYFFRKDIVDNFKKNVMALLPPEKKESFPLSSYGLYNVDDILENIGQRGTLKTRFTEKSPEYQELRKKNMDKLIKYLSSKICGDITSDYAKKAVEKAISLTARENIFDIIVLSSKNIESIAIEEDEEDEEDRDEEAEVEDSGDDEEEEYTAKSATSSIDDIIAHRLSGVVGFIIVELGECKTYPHGYSINLICTNNKAPAGSGSILMGLYLYTILSHPDKTDTEAIIFPPGKGELTIVEKPHSADIEDTDIEYSFSTLESLTPVQQFGILELASAYTNPGGLCMYEKFGFQYTESMFGTQCFEDFSNLPMLIDFKTKPGYAELSTEQKKQKILNITTGTDKGFPKSKICSVRDSYINPAGKNILTREQTLLGYLKTLKLLIDHDMSRVIGVDADKPIEDLYYTIKFINEPKSRTPYEERPEPSNPGSVDAYINYLETPLISRTGTIDLIRLTSLIPIKKSRGGTKRKNGGKNKRTKKPNKTNKTKKLKKNGKRQTKSKR